MQSSDFISLLQSDSGDVTDCVEIYKQPAFDHPLLSNHTIEMEPSSTPSGVKPINNQAKLIQDWFKNGECPDGTIPIIRPQRYDYNWIAPRKLDSNFGLMKIMR
ncbi:putative neprosin activation peptide [Rosa chinensis]|uniref:Putative neprosin activation peptide n=1 Tax=Rosa chinensis TaxID=74649 RepID=A0A2P6RXT0_ROSCH|nr:putative neprosin activation peptide [Rosa chinensis]